MRLKVSDLLPGTGYAVQVRAIRAGQSSQWSERFTFTTDQNANLPSTPGSVTWSVSEDAFVATWAPVTVDTIGGPVIIESYELEFVGNSITKIISVPAQTGATLSYTLTFAENAALFTTAQPTVTLRVRAVNNKGLKSAWSSVLSASNPVPPNVTNFVANALQNSVELSWDPVTAADLDRYEVYYSTSGSGFTPSGANRIFTGRGTRTVFYSPSYVTHYFKVRAYDKFNQPSAADASASATPQSPFVTDTTAPAVPTGLNATLTTSADATQTTADVSWTANVESDLAGYRIRYRPAGTTQWLVTTVGTDSPPVRIDRLIPYTNYEFQIQAFDWQQNDSAYSGTATGTGSTNSAPPTPQAPGASSSTMRIQVTPTGLDSTAAAMPADVAYYEVFASTSSGFTTYNSTTQLGVIPVGPAMTAAFQIPASGGLSTQTWYVKVRAVDKGGLTGPASAQTTATPGLIDATNIIDASITNAKIFNLRADQIIAGTGLINDITVKSKLTLGDASTVGYIETYDYTTSSGTTGAQFSKNGIIIKTGAIEAAALKIQTGANMMPPQFADFEANSDVYSVTAQPNASAVQVTTTPKFNANAYQVTRGASVAGFSAYLAQNTTAYNIAVEGSTAYIVSCYVRNRSAVTTNFNMNVKWSDGTVSSGTPITPTISSSTWVRFSFVATSPAAATGALVYVSSTTTTSGAQFEIDGVQFEAKTGALTTPSAWNPPGATTIDGALIKTGAIRSSTNLTINSITTPTWSINTDGTSIFGNTWLRGDVKVGYDAAEGTATSISSYNYEPAVNGWAIFSDGTADFRGVASETFNGQSIMVNTLSPGTWKNGEMNSVIDLRGILQATGGMGEQVRMGAHGFDVWGPNETPVSTAVATTTQCTLTTAAAHGIAVGQTIYVEGIGSPFDGSFVAVTGTTGTTLKYDRATTGTAVSSFSPPAGIAYGQDTLNVDDDIRPRTLYVNFPTDRAKPNIISGKLESNILNVSTSATFRGLVEIGVGSVFNIASAILAPKAAPSVAASYSETQFTGISGDYYVTGGVRGHDNYIYVPAVRWMGTSASNRITKHYISNGGKYDTPIDMTTTVDWGFRQIAYYNNNYYVLYQSGQKAFSNITIRRYNTSWAAQQNYSIYTGTGVKFGACLGWNHAANRPIIMWKSGSDMLWEEYTIDGTGAITGLNSSGTLNGAGFADPRFVMRGAFDIGSERIVFSTDTSSAPFYVWSPSTGNRVSTEEWPTGTDGFHAAAWWDTSYNKFYELSTDLIRYEYVGGDSYWISSNNHDKRWLAYSFYASAATPSATETDLSPRALINLPKRASISVTISPIPGGAGTQAPNWARVYLADQDNDPLAPGSSGASATTVWKLRRASGVTSSAGSILYPGTSFKVVSTENLVTSPNPVNPQVGNQFTGGAGTTPGQIQSTTGNSYWKGDDSVQFKQMRLTSTNTATTSAGNMPPAKIGNLDLGGNAAADGPHLRMDGDGIIGMASNSVTNNFSLRAATVRFNLDDGDLKIWGGTNIRGKLATNTGSGTSLSFKDNSVAATVETFDGATYNNANTTMFYARELHTSGTGATAGVYDDDLAGGGATGANINNNGRIVRTSSKQMKTAIKKMQFDEAKTVLGLESYTFEYKKEKGKPKDPRRYPGFIAEQGAEAGAELWVGRQHEPIYDDDGNVTGFKRDKNGPIKSFRTADVVVAHNMIVKDLVKRVEELEAEIASIKNKEKK